MALKPEEVNKESAGLRTSGWNDMSLRDRRSWPIETISSPKWGITFILLDLPSYKAYDSLGKSVHTSKGGSYVCKTHFGLPCCSGIVNWFLFGMQPCQCDHDKLPGDPVDRRAQ